MTATIKPHATLWTLVARGGDLPPGNHVERLDSAFAAQMRLSTLRTAAQAKGEPLVARTIPPILEN